MVLIVADRRLSQAVLRPDPAGGRCDRRRIDRVRGSIAAGPAVRRGPRSHAGSAGRRRPAAEPTGRRPDPLRSTPIDRDPPRPPRTAVDDAAFEVARQTLLVLLPEMLILLSATVMMTAGAFVRLPRRTWCAIGASATLVAALVVLFAVGDRPVDALLGRSR